MKIIIFPIIAFFAFLMAGLEAAGLGWYLIACGLFVLTAFAGILVISIGGRTR